MTEQEPEYPSANSETIAANKMQESEMVYGRRVGYWFILACMFAFCFSVYKNLLFSRNWLEVVACISDFLFLGLLLYDKNLSTAGKFSKVRFCVRFVPWL